MAVDTGVVKNKTLGYDFVLPEILQEDLENFEKAMDEFLEPETTISNIKVATYNGAVVRAAIKVGWLDPLKLTVDQVSKMKPGAIGFLALALSEHISAAREIPPS